MKKENIFFVFILVFLNLEPFKVLAQIDTNNIYDKFWRTKSFEIIKPNSTLPVYFRYENKGIADYGSVISVFKRDGTTTGFNAGGWPSPGSYKLLPGNQIFIDGDEQPSQIRKLTSTEFSLEMTQPYTNIITNETFNITTKITYESFDPCAVYESLRSGDWDDPTIWTCQKIPTVNDRVQISQNHKVTVPNTYMAYAKTVKQIGKLDLKQGAKLILDQ